MKRTTSVLLLALLSSNLQAVVWDVDEYGGYAYWNDLYVSFSIARFSNDPVPHGQAWVDGSGIASRSLQPTWIPTIPSVLTIPSECGGAPVTYLANSALYGLERIIYENEVYGGRVLWHGGVSTIIVPDTVTRIGASCFGGNSMLRNVVLPSGLQSIGEQSFRWCTGLTSIVLPDSLAEIPSGLFLMCTNLTSVSLPRQLKRIGNGAFRDCESLSSLSIPNTVETIGSGVFDNCRSLTSLSIPDSVTTLEDQAFLFSSLRSLHLPTRFFGRTDGLGIPEGCTVTFGNPLDLTVRSGVERTFPAPGVTTLFKGANVTCRAETFTDPQNDGIQYECLGWTGTGSVPSSGTGQEVSFVLDVPSSISWNWKTNVWIDCVVSGEVAPSSVEGWRSFGESIVIPFSIDDDNPSVVFSGDSEGVVFDAAAKTVSIPADRPRKLAVRIGFGTKVFTHVVLSPQAGGDAEWRMAESSLADDGYCLRSGEISQGETSTVEMQVSGPGSFSFDWRISANRSDWAYFYVDGAQMTSITRTTDWANVSTNLASGTHVLRWVFDRHAATAANDEAAFLDNVSWRPRLSLTVSSDYGTATPAVGTSLVSYGDLVSAYVVAPAPANGTRRVCTGWIGTGSVPAEGRSDALQFAMTKPTTLSWQWRTDHWIDVSVVSGGTTAFEPKWVQHGTTVSVSVVPDTHLYSISLSGDTSGVTVSGTTISIPATAARTIRVSISERKLPLEIETSHGTAVPESGIHSLSWGSFVTAFVSDPAPDNGYSYHCIGWSGRGSVPETGTSQSVNFTIEESSAVSWLWRTNVWIELEVSGAIVVDVSGQWIEIGDSLVVPYAPLSDFATFTIGGDATGVVVDQQALTITIPADRPRSVTVTATAMSLASALDAKGLVWNTSGGDVWIPQRAITSDGVDAAVSGDATGGDNLLETSVLGPGTLSWFWKINAAGWAGVDASVDGRDIAYLETTGDWTSASTQISGEGPHSVRFAFWTEEGCTSSDRAYLDRVSWTGTPVPRATQTTPEDIPHAWLDRWPDILAKNGGDYERAAAAIAANGINAVWECFVAGLNPTDPSAAFRVDISMDGDEPRIGWTPDLGAARDYRLEGRAEFDDRDGWKSPVTDNHRFFRARVALPDASGSVEEDDAFPGFVTVTFDANGGTVETKHRDYTATGTLGTLPIPSWNDIPFLGWYSAPTGGVRFTQQTHIPYRDTRVYAQWNCFAVRFDAHGGSGTMPEVACPTKGHIGLPSVVFSKSGYFFRGWSLAPEGEVLFPDGSDFSDNSSESGDIRTLYAVWEPNRCVFHFEPNGGTGTMPDAALASGETLPENQFDKSNYFFMGWATNRFSDVVLGNQDTLLIEDNGGTVSLYAVWSEYRPGLAARYFNISSSGYETWIESESSLFGYFADKTPAMITNTADWANGLDAGFSSSIGTTGDNWVYSGMTRPNSVCSFHGTYASSSKNTFAVQLSGCLNVEQQATYQFSAVADDSVVLYIDGERILENGANWVTMATGEVELSAGMHTISIGFYENTGGQGLSIQWKTPGESSYAPIPKTKLFHRTGSDLLVFLSNGGTGEMLSIGVDRNFGTMIPNCSFSRAGMEFDGWTTETNGVVVFQPGDTLPPLMPTVTELELFAKWWGPTWKFTISNNQILLTGVEEPYPAHLVIPSQVDGYPVTCINKGAFKRCSGLISVTIPNGVRSIGEDAFSYCSRLTSITIPDSVTSIGGYAFYGCSGLTSITIPDSVMSIGDGAFLECPNLNEIHITDLTSWLGISFRVSVFSSDKTNPIRLFLNEEELLNLAIPAGVENIQSYAFCGISGFMSITIPNSVTNIGVRAFNGCAGLASIVIADDNPVYDSRNGCNAIIKTADNELVVGCRSSIIPKSVTRIGDCAFWDCFGLTSITIPDSVTSIGACAFRGCSGLTSITIPDSVTNIAAQTFFDCSGLTSITIPDSVTSISDWAFRGCSGLTSITIPDSVTSIGERAFMGCSRLASITIPDSVTSIGNAVFRGCSGLTSVTIPDGIMSIGFDAFYGCRKLTSVMIPDSVTRIGSFAFYNCSGLTSITIPDSVASIESGAFSGCSGLTSLSLPSRFEGNTSNMGIPNGCTVTFRE